MKSIIITPKNHAELKLLTQLLNKMNIASAVLSEEEKENMGMAILMKKADRTKTISRKTIMKKLTGQ